MKKIFALTGEPSGDKLASKVITQLKNSRSDIEYLSVGGEHLKALGIKSIFDIKEVTYLGFTKVLFAGKVKRPNFSTFRIDLKGFYYLPRIIKSSKFGDAAVLKEIINILKQEKISTVSQLSFNPELTLKKGTTVK